MQRLVVLVWIVLFVFYEVQCSNEVEDVIVKLPAGGGVISGISFESSPGGPTCYAFKGIPYAKPPTGNLRFKAPQPYGAIEGTFKADTDGPVCPQWDTKSNSVIGSEDCLKLNVFIHQKPTTKAGAAKYPIIVILHHGGFQSGSSNSDIYNPRRFLDREIIVVTFNYRLGALGFFSINDEMSPGNYGLLDQVEALRWIQKNIGAFGGDVNQVTLFGYEAGGASGVYHVLSPLSKGLFHRVISLSGSPVCDTNIQKKPKDVSEQIGTKLDCFVDEPRALVNCMRKRTVVEIVTASHELHTLGEKFPVTFIPAVERVFKEHGDFLPDSPLNLIKDGKVNKVPVIFGVSNYQGKLLFQDVKNAGLLQDKIQFLEKAMPEILKQTTHLKYYHDDISKAIKSVYYSDNENALDDESQFENITTEVFADYLERSCIDLTAKHLSKVGWPTYIYTAEKMSSTIANSENIYPDELRYLFEPVGAGEKTEQEMKLRRIILSIWSNFAKTSMPTPTRSPDLPLTWMPLNPGKIRYLKVSYNSTLVEGSINPQIAFWNTKVPKIESGNKKDEL
ncbi:hypothetical protein CHUAL_006908 [Chamberlinius hualienensis]